MRRTAVITLEARCPLCLHPVVARERCSEYLPETVECILLEARGCLTCILSARFVEQTVAAKGETWTREHLATMFHAYERYIRHTHEPEPVVRLRAALLDGSTRDLEA
jgi:hypothetical protein